jgi:hypothetical protein
VPGSPSAADTVLPWGAASNAEACCSPPVAKALGSRGAPPQLGSPVQAFGAPDPASTCDTPPEALGSIGGRFASAVEAVTEAESPALLLAAAEDCYGTGAGGAADPITPFTALAAALGRSAREVISGVGGGGGAIAGRGALADADTGYAAAAPDAAVAGADADVDAAPTPMTAAIKAIGAATARRRGAWKAAAVRAGGGDGRGTPADDTAAVGCERDTPSKGMAGLFALGDEEGLVAAVAALEGEAPPSL